MEAENKWETIYAPTSLRLVGKELFRSVCQRDEAFHSVRLGVQSLRVKGAKVKFDLLTTAREVNSIFSVACVT